MGKFDCKGILRTMSDYINGDLGESICGDIEMHLTTCRKCRFHVDAVKYTISLFDEWRADDMPADAMIRLRDRLRDDAGCFVTPPAGAGRKETAPGKAAARKTAGKKTAAKKSARKKAGVKKTARRKTGAGKTVRKRASGRRQGATRKK